MVTTDSPLCYFFVCDTSRKWHIILQIVYYWRHWDIKWSTVCRLLIDGHFQIWAFSLIPKGCWYILRFAVILSQHNSITGYSSCIDFGQSPSSLDWTNGVFTLRICVTVSSAVLCVILVNKNYGHGSSYSNRFLVMRIRRYVRFVIFSILTE